MRHGFTVPELVMALAVLALCLGIAVPHLTAIRNSLRVEQAAQQLMAAHRRARVSAIVQGRPAELTVGPEAFLLRFMDESRFFWSAPGPASLGVALDGPVRRFTFSPVGVTTGLANATFRLQSGAAARTIVVSRLGRVRRARP